jgi:predicted MFS family arabinose efflux permease
MSGIAVGMLVYFPSSHLCVLVIGGDGRWRGADVRTTGGVIYILMFDHLIKTASFPWAIRAIGFVALVAALLSIPALLSGSAWLKHKRKQRALFDRSALRDRLFLLFTCCSFSTFLGYIVPYFYIPTFARERLGSSESTALYMLVLSIAGSFFGRLASGVAAQWVGAIVTWMFCAFASGVLALSWIGVETERGFIAFSILWGKSCVSQLLHL